MALGRLQASLASATNDITVAAANINFDFTLVKCEAPKEYHELGNVLTRKRKDEAEMGLAHVTARRLGALFEGVCSPTPNLIKAYGIRVSEIAEAAKKTSSEPPNSIFAAHAGVDGTSIWAAATSSSTALHVQLLACMLARVWNPPEAISIWVELVQERKKDIASRYDGGEELHFSTVAAAAQSEISRASLAEWDASARSWLRTADNTKSLQQHQLMLIIANVNIPINKDMEVLSSVLTAWKLALDSMERIISGMPQAANIGATLLGLSSWHIYPNLLVIGKETTQVQLNDPLVSPGGVITVGLEPVGNNKSLGLYWSLSLAHMNYYGHPERTSANLNQDSAKISFTQFTQAVFGCLLGNWSLRESGIDGAARFFISFQAAITRVTENDTSSLQEKAAAMDFIQDSSHWWNLMAEAAWAYLEKSSEDRSTAHKLVKLGLRRSSSFIPEPSRKHFFGFSDPATLLACLKSTEERVSFLRSIASTCSPTPEPLLIQYADIYGLANFATALPLLQESKKRKRETEVQDQIFSHYRWLVSEDDSPSTEVCTKQAVWMFSQVTSLEANFNFFHSESGPMREYSFMYGDPHLAAIYGCRDRPANHFNFKSLTVENLISLLDSDQFSIEALLSHINEKLDPLLQINKTMKAISTAAKIYKLLPNATFSVEVLDKPIFSTKWAEALSGINATTLSGTSTAPRNDRKSVARTLDRSSAISCVAYMESRFDIEPSNLTGVIALAFEDSLYIAMALTCDPWDRPDSYELKRALGNIGKPGLTFLVSPKSPCIVRSKNPSSWKVISHEEFNGCAENHFATTSLHLSFTKYYVPLYQDSGHKQDNEVFFLESVVSIYDSGAWVGDIDILRALADNRVDLIFAYTCHHTNKEKLQLNKRIVSCEGWDDLLDPPVESFVVRANSNWVGRLAATALLSQSLPDNGWDKDIKICPNTMCWICNSLWLGSDRSPASNNTTYLKFKSSERSGRAMVAPSSTPHPSQLSLLAAVCNKPTALDNISLPQFLSESR